MIRTFGGLAIIGALAVAWPGAVAAQQATASLEQQVFDALQKYCIATGGESGPAYAAAEADGWISQGQGTARYFRRPGSQPFALAARYLPGREGEQPVHKCVVQAPGGSAAAIVPLILGWLPDSEMSSGGGARIFAYVNEPSGPRPITEATPAAELNELMRANRLSVVALNADTERFEIGVMLPPAN